MKRIVFFAHFNKNQSVYNYVLEYLKGLAEIAEKIVFISSSPINDDAKDKIKQYTSDIITKDNKGYDFGSWQAGLRHIGYKNLDKYDEVILCNDSCFAPLFPFSEMFNEMQKRTCQAWSITYGYSDYNHLQSYFLVFKKDVFTKDYFINFFESCKEEADKYAYITKYEVGLSELLNKNKVKIDSYIKINKFLLFFQYLCRLSKLLKRLFITKLSVFKKISSYVSYNKNNKIILNHEILGEILLLNKIRSFFNPFNSNPSIQNALYIVKKFRCPIIKTMVIRQDEFIKDMKLLEKNIDNWKEIIQSCSNYNTDLIEDYLKDIK